MTEPTETQVVINASLLDGLDNMIGVGGVFNAAIISLFKNLVVPSRDSILADFDVADFAGYSDSAAITWQGPYYDVDGSVLAVGDDVLFEATGASPANTIYGYILATAARAALIAAYAFQAPVGIAKTGDAVLVTPFIRYSGD